MTELYDEMCEAYYCNDDFTRYVDRNARTYNKTLKEVLQSPITEAYYKSLKKGGCNHHEYERTDI